MSNYTLPKERQTLKNKIKRSKKAGLPGTWSARRAQLLNREYVKFCKSKKVKPFKGKKTKAQRSLQSWSKKQNKKRRSKN